jgi:hypothetical protein
MSARIQRLARDRRDNANQRAERSRERAEESRERGDEAMARFHERAAYRQAVSAANAERERLIDVAAEGEQLGEDEPSQGASGG